MPPVAIHHFETAGGRDPINEFLDDQSPEERAVCDELLAWLETGEIDRRPRHRDYLGDGIWELRLAYNRKQYRFLYAVERGRAYILVAFIKKTPQTPPQQLKRAKQRLRELVQRGIVR